MGRSANFVHFSVKSSILRQSDRTTPCWPENNMKAKQLESALAALDRLDPDLKSARATYGNPPDRFEQASFSTLVRIILGQQISRAVASHLWERMKAKGWQDEHGLKGLAYEDLQAIGLSRRKAEYILDLASAINSNSLDFETLNSQDRQIFRQRLIAHRGIGDWTINNYRLFCLADLDAWPGNDLALMEAVKRLKSLDARPSHKEMDQIAAGWAPYRGAAALLLWHLYACLVRDSRPTG